MLHGVIALVLLSASAGAADFRTLNFGYPCAGVEEKEQALGSREYDRDLFMTHFCPKGSLVTGNYSVPNEQFDDALKTYRSTYGKLVSLYGSPVFDSTPSLVGTNTESLVGAPDRTKYSAAWRTSRAIVTISIMPNQPSEVSGWRVFVVIGQSSK